MSFLKQPLLEDELEQAYWMVTQKGVSRNPSTTELAGYVIYLLSDSEVDTKIPLADTVAYLANSLNATTLSHRKIFASQLVQIAASPDFSDLLREIICGYASSKTALGPGRTAMLNGPHPGNDKVGKIWRNELYAGGVMTSQ